MTRHRIFCGEVLQDGLSLRLSDSAARHVQVLRLQPGSLIELFNGSGEAFAAHIDLMGKHSVDITVVQALSSVAKPINHTHIVVGMPANERMDWLVEKATELGVSRITPVMTQRTVLRLNGERAVRRVEHWQGIAQSACSQSGRNFLPQIDVPLSLNDFLNGNQSHAQSLNIILSLQAQAPAWRELWTMRPSHMTLLTGPEGGLTSEEEASALQHGFVAASLGPFVLRAETAALAVLAQLL
jgi:16S rRNA (uracil1498-N3)-methyltransferase